MFVSEIVLRSSSIFQADLPIVYVTVVCQLSVIADMDIVRYCHNDLLIIYPKKNLGLFYKTDGWSIPEQTKIEMPIFLLKKNNNILWKFLIKLEITV